MRTRPKYLIAALCGMMILVTCAAGCTSNVANQTSNIANQTSSASSNMTTYNSGNFTIQYPKGWLNATVGSRTLDTFSVTCTTKNNTFVGAIFVNSSTSIAFSSYTATHVGDMQNNSNVTLIDTGNATLAGNPAYKIVYTTTYAGAPKKTMEIWTVKDGKAYIITYRASPEYYDVYADTAQKMIDSFQIK